MANYPKQFFTECRTKSVIINRVKNPLKNYDYYLTLMADIYINESYIQKNSINSEAKAFIEAKRLLS